MPNTISKPRISSIREVITKSEQLGLPADLHRMKSGKVRELFKLSGERYLFVARDGWSAYDHIMEQGIPNKGTVLTQMSNLTFQLTSDIVPNHIITTDMSEAFKGVENYLHLLNGRSVIVKAAEPIMFECVVRGYIYGSGWEDYQADNGFVCGIPLPPGLSKASKLDEPIFTPATKSMTGHDENVTFEYMERTLGPALAQQLKETSIAVYNRLADHAEKRGQILADTKFEFGFVDGKLTLIDEAVTPDSSRIWNAQDYKVGQDQNSSSDKQFLRDYVRKTMGWTKADQDRGVPAPLLPQEVIAEAAGRYLNAYKMFAGKDPRVVAILAGSTSDLGAVHQAEAVLEKLGIWFGTRVVSAHRTPRKLIKLLEEVDADPTVAAYITAAGLTAALGGAVAAWTIKPVVAMPLNGELSVMDGLDSVLSTVQMAPGVPVGTVGPVGNGKNAGLYAAQILAVGDPQLRQRLRETLRKEE